MSNSGETTEPIPYSVTFEGKILPERLPELITLLGEISADQSVSFQVGPPEQVEPLTKISIEDFRRVWNRDGAGQSWGRLRRVIDEHPNFPLKVVESETVTGGWYLEGDLEAAAEWLRLNPINRNGESGVVLSIINILAKGEN